jgi:hypothetical protein
MLKNRSLFTKFTTLACVMTGTVVYASGGRPVDIPERARGAERIVVATAVNVTPSWRQNEHGDQLIVSQVLLQVEETIKGEPDGTALLDLEGGTLNGFTLRVSDLPTLRAGERAVFFLDRTASSAHAPHLRGLGILKLDAGNRVVGSSLRLDDIRRMSQNAGR